MNKQRELVMAYNPDSYMSYCGCRNNQSVQIKPTNTALIPVVAGVLYLAFGNSGVPPGLHFILGNYGFLNPILATGAMVASSLTVVSNSLRLKRFRPAKFGN